MTHFILLSATLLAACAGGTPEISLPEASSEDDACGASGLSHLVGEDFSALAAMTFPDTTRFIGPDDAVTMDHVPERLNVEFSEDGRVLRIWCG